MLTEDSKDNDAPLHGPETRTIAYVLLASAFSRFADIDWRIAETATRSDGYMDAGGKEGRCAPEFNLHND